MQAINRDDYRVPVLTWCPEIEEGAQKQIDNLARLPFVMHHVSIMPDCHSGYGMPIGGVIACDRVVIPNAVGVDIGCGVLATKTHLRDLSIDQVKQIIAGIRERVPVGPVWHKEPAGPLPDMIVSLPVVEAQVVNARLQLGTLGGGNHFIEIQRDDQGFIWFMIHSGSRNLGKRVADYYNKVAKVLNGRWFSSVPKEWDLAFLPVEDPLCKLYMEEMKYCVEFAQRNREVMASLVKQAFSDIVGGTIKYARPINIAHNYAAWENVRGKNLIVHRKGATSARAGQLGIVPGSQGSASYIVEGLGNPKSFNSCSHGAGRKLGRNQAKKTLDLNAEIEGLDRQGIVHGIRTEADLDEAPGAYKDIDEVMANQADLVEIVTRLTPLGVVKG